MKRRWIVEFAPGHEFNGHDQLVFRTYPECEIPGKCVRLHDYGIEGYDRYGNRQHLSVDCDTAEEIPAFLESRYGEWASIRAF